MKRSESSETGFLPPPVWVFSPTMLCLRGVSYHFGRSAAVSGWLADTAGTGAPRSGASCVSLRLLQEKSSCSNQATGRKAWHPTPSLKVSCPAVGAGGSASDRGTPPPALLPVLL